MKKFIKYCLGLLVIVSVTSYVFASGEVSGKEPFPNTLDVYGDDYLIKDGKIFDVLANRINHTPFNLWASLIFLFAIIHTFFASKITAIAKNLERNHAEKMSLEGKSEEEIDLAALWTRCPNL